MSKENVLNAWKNPLSRDGQNHHPAGNVLEELQREEMEVLAGGAWWNISKNLGNNGKICTITKECQDSCN